MHQLLAAIRSPWTIPVVAGATATLFMGIFVPFSDDTGTGQRWFFSALIGMFAAYGAWSISGVVAMIAGGLRGRGQAPSAGSIHHKGPLPALSASRRTAVRAHIAAMAEYGIFAPDVPDPALLYPGIAEMDEAVQPDTIFSAVGEIDYYHSDVNPGRFGANLLMFDSKAEQDADYLRSMTLALARLTGLAVSDVSIDTEWPPSSGSSVPVRIQLNLGDEQLSIAYLGTTKYGSTHLPYAIAARLDAAATGKRLAWLWTDQGAWISSVADGAVEALNASLKLGSRKRCQWEWVTDAAPFAAGETAPAHDQ
jgi:hypothetical protein